MPISHNIGKSVPSVPRSLNPDSAELLALSRAVLQLGPDRRDPERFYLDKSEISHRLKKLARELEAG